MSTKQKRQENKSTYVMMQKKLVLIFALVVLAFVLLLFALVRINVKKGDEYTKKVLNQQIHDGRVIPYKRGDILDRNGTKLATSDRVYNVILDVKAMLTDDGKYMEDTINVLESCFGIEGEEIRKIAQEEPENRYKILKKGASYEEEKAYEKIKEEGEMKGYGIWLEEDFIRRYPYNSLACDVLGFTSNGNVGNNGIEGYYNSVLNGTDGREYGYHDEDSVAERAVQAPVNGQSVVTTIDVQVQSIVEKHVLAFNEARVNNAKEGLGSKNTAVIVMNPQNGEILAEASYPNYDLNDPRKIDQYYKEEDYKAMTDEKKAEAMNALWKNFAVSDTFEPGSTIKPFTVATGLETGALYGDEFYDCQGMLHVGTHDIHCAKRSGHGTQDLKQAMENSCNVALMQIGFAIGKEDLCKYQDIFGFGHATGIDLPGEVSTAGLLYTPETMDDTSLATNAFGQNFNVTMTQLITGFSSIINGGNYYKPHVVKQIKDENDSVIKNIDPVLQKRTISRETSTMVKDYMRGVVEEGSGKLADIPGYEIGGKTGTAEKQPRDMGTYLVSFIGYAPQENPEIVIYVVIDEPNEENQAQSSLAVQLAADIMQEVFPYLGITKTGAETE